MLCLFLIATSTYYIWLISSLTFLKKIFAYLVSVYLSFVIAALFAEHAANFIERRNCSKKKTG
jgi:hypothetical protein